VKEIKLTLIGYWQNEDEIDLPIPSNFVDKTWNKTEQEEVVSYLKSAYLMPYASGGLSWCRFRCGNNANGSQEFTDGYYIWPEGLVHYIEKHNVKLPLEFINHCLTNKKLTAIKENDSFIIDLKWWLNQKGDNKKGPKSYLTPASLEKASPNYYYIEVSLPSKFEKTEYWSFIKDISEILEINPFLIYKKVANEGKIIYKAHSSKYFMIQQLNNFENYIKSSPIE
jgi:hypothetical protein